MTTSPVLSISDEQIAEMERDAIARNNLKPGQCEGGHKLHSSHACGVCGAGPQDGCRRRLPASYNSSPAILALIARLRAAEKDAGRYRWLRDEAVDASGTYPMVSLTDDSGEQVSNWLFGGAVDRAIDAAMTGEKP